MPLLSSVQPAGIIPNHRGKRSEWRKAGRQAHEKSRLIICGAGNFKNSEVRPWAPSVSPGTLTPWTRALREGNPSLPGSQYLAPTFPHHRLLHSPRSTQSHRNSQAWKRPVLTKLAKGEKKKNCRLLFLIWPLYGWRWWYFWSFSFPCLKFR